VLTEENNKKPKTTQCPAVHTVLLHQGQELDNDLGGRADQDLALATLLSVVDVVEAVVQDGDADHFDMLLYTLKK